MSQTQLRTRAHAAVEYEQQAEKLSLESSSQTDDNGDRAGHAVEAKFITPLDPVIETTDGNRLPAVPVQEAHKINLLKSRSEGRPYRPGRPRGLSRFDRQRAGAGAVDRSELMKDDHESESSRLDEAIPVLHTHPLFPPLPLYGAPSLLRDLQCTVLRTTSAVLSTAFLTVIVLGALFTSIPHFVNYAWLWLTFRDPYKQRPFYDEERRRLTIRKEQEEEWERRTSKQDATIQNGTIEPAASSQERLVALEGGPDKLVCDIRYYARRVGLDAEEFKVQTEDGFILTLWHIYSPSEYTPRPSMERQPDEPSVFTDSKEGFQQHIPKQYSDGNRRYPVLLVHGLLQSAGAYCANDDDSLAFYLCKSGYDVWLGNNRCGFSPEHSLLKYHDPRMWAWNIRQMGVMDLPAFMSRVLVETGFEKLGLVCHSQGTTEAFVALAKEQRPDLGDRISVFCALAPAVYAGPLIGKMYFKLMRVISPSMFRVFFGIHSFIPLMMTMHRMLPGKLYGALGYRVFSFLFNWTDTRWDRGLRDRLFQFSPVYVSAESMRWWLGRECFAKQKCILATREDGQNEEVEDGDGEESSERASSDEDDRGRTAWYDEHVPPLALWVAGSDDLVDGRRLLRRFQRGREPFVQVVHSKVIEEYEHLDVLWAMDAVEQVGSEVRQVLWKTMPEEARRICRKISGVVDDDRGDSQGSDQQE
ncbi:alpha/beta-hydrolase lipase domain-containing protein [Cladophialophora immunda]|nr:alpha/beta-hydrolase lipase domain-containing protein [Cladophialophora immunda]